jgi:hypothetical protein
MYSDHNYCGSTSDVASPEDSIMDDHNYSFALHDLGVSSILAFIHIHIHKHTQWAQID